MPIIKYGIVTITPKTALCVMENGGDKDDEAIYRFSDTDKRVKRSVSLLVCDTNTMKDLYGSTWVKTKYGWVKDEGKIRWFDSYKEAKQSLMSKNNRKQKVARTILTIITAALVIYLGYKLITLSKTDTAYETPME